MQNSDGKDGNKNNNNNKNINSPKNTKKDKKENQSGKHLSCCQITLAPFLTSFYSFLLKLFYLAIFWD